MSKLTYKIAIPIVLIGVFAIVIFIALNYEQMDSSFYIVFALLVVYVFFFGIATGQNLSSPIRKILDGATELSKGNQSSRIYLESKDELAELAKVFNKIAEELEESHKQSSDMEKSVGIKVKARTRELEETINALEQKVKNRTIELERLIGESNRLQIAMKGKGAETSELKEELGTIKQKIGRYKKPAQASEEEVV